MTELVLVKDEQFNSTVPKVLRNLSFVNAKIKKKYESHK